LSAAREPSATEAANSSRIVAAATRDSGDEQPTGPRHCQSPGYYHTIAPPSVPAATLYANLRRRAVFHRVSFKGAPEAIRFSLDGKLIAVAVGKVVQI
jgi:hypothetical protein